MRPAGVSFSLTPSAHPGDVLVSTVRPERGTVGVVRDEQGACICTTGFAVLRPKSIHPLLLAHLLKTDFVLAQLLRHNVGIAYPAIDESCLPDVLLPIRVDDLKAFDSIGGRIIELETILQDARSQLAAQLSHAVSTWSHHPITPDPTPHPMRQTTSHHRPRKLDSDGHVQDSPTLWEDRRA